MNIHHNIRIKFSVVTVSLLMTVVSAACSPAAPLEPTPAATGEQQAIEICVDEDTGTQMAYEQAVAIAEGSSCVDQGPLKETHLCNGTTGTWWIDLDIDQPGCAPACVVDIVDQTADINWRCTGATAPDEDATDTPAAEPAAAESAADQEPAPTDRPIATPDPIADWPKYASQGDGFAFRYPPTWTIELLIDRQAEAGGDQPARAVQLTRDDLQLLIEFKRPDEGAIIGPGSMPPGTVEQRDSVVLFGRELPKNVLIDEEKVKVIFVGDRYPDIEIYIQLITDVDDDTAEIPAAAREELDQILATFARTGPQAEGQDAYPGWDTYTSSDIVPGVAFAFRYRPDWTLTETKAGTETPTGPSTAMALLQRDTYVVRVQYKHTEDETTMITTDVSDSLLMEAGTAWLLGRPVSRLVVVDEERLTHVFASYADDTLLITIDLSQDPTLVAEGDRDLPVGIRNEMDEILASFKLITP